MEMEPDKGTMSEQIEEVLELTRENNKLLKRIRRDAIIGGILKIAVWVVLIFASFYFSMKFIEPYLGMLQAPSAQESGSQNNMDMGALIEQYKSLLGQ